MNKWVNDTACYAVTEARKRKNNLLESLKKLASARHAARRFFKRSGGAFDNRYMTLSEQLEFLTKGTVDVIPVEELKKKLETAAATGRKLRVKLGCDPTAPDLHLGQSVVIRSEEHKSV